MNARLASRWIICGALATTILLFITARSGIALDNNGNGISDIWDLLYPSATNPIADNDGDGVSNRDESIWGTNPLQPDSQHPTATLVVLNPATGLLDISWHSVAGKRYQLQSNTNLTAGSWTNDGAFVDGLTNVTTLTNSRALTLQAKMYRVQASDKDADNDGVNDWEEIAVGLDPNKTNSNVDGIHDGAYVTNQLALPNTVKIQATQSFASEDGPTPGIFTISRTQKLLPIAVNYTTGGTAIVGTEYAPLSGSVTMKSGTNTATITVNPVSNPSVKGSRSVTVTLVPPGGSGPGFTLDPSSTATVIINDSTAPNGTGLLARYYDTASGVYSNAANFGQAGTYQYTRATATNGSIVVSNAVPSPTISGLQVGHLVRLTFTSGNLNNALYNHSNYTVTAVTASNFNVGITGDNLTNSGNGNCSFSVQSIPHPAVIERVDPVVNFNWLQGTPNGVVIPPNNSPDNYSVVWEGYLNPTNIVATNYAFQLDADDKARVLLDLNNGSGLQQILEHGWDGPATVGTFKTNGGFNLVLPATPTNRYRMRVEFVETTNDARCRLQWQLGSGAFADIPATRMFTHTRAANYVYTRILTTNGPIITTNGTAVVTLTNHTFDVSNHLELNFSAGNLFTPLSYSGTYTITATNTNTFTVDIAGASLPNSDTNARACFVGDSTSATAGWLTRYYTNTAFAGSPTLVRTNGAVTDGNTGINTGIWGTGTPDVNLIVPDTFSIRWTGQVQPQFSEEYTFVVNAGDSVKLWINGQPQTLRVASAANSASTYSYVSNNSVSGQAVVTYTNIPAGSFSNGEFVLVDPTTGTLLGLGYSNYSVTAVTPTTLTIGVDASGLSPGPTNGTGNCNVEWINKPINWPNSVTNDRYARISLVGGVRYDIQLDYFENTSSANCQLSWYSPSQPKQIIPSSRLYPANGTLAPASFTDQTDATALVGGLFSYAINGNNGALVTVSNAPAWLTYNNGLLSGTPPPGSTGDYQVIVTITNAAGASTSVLNLHVTDTGGTIVREHWNGVPGTNVSAIPINNPASGTSSLASLEAPVDFGDDYGARIRGYITAPVTGNYYFWIAANNAAELWISNDDEPINTYKRAWVATGNATNQTWNGEANQKSPWLALEQGKRYYIEILHKAGTGSGDNLAVGWAKPGEATTAPSQVVPGYVLSPYATPSLASTPGTLYVATMLSQSGAATPGVGTSTLRLSADENTATMTYSYSSLTGPITSQHIHTDAYLSKPSTIVYDIDTPITPGDGLQPDGSYKWTILPVGVLSKAEIIEIIKQGKAYINLHTAMYPAGEIRGNYTLANGSRNFTPPPAPPALADDSNSNNGAARFLTQATFGPNPADIAALVAIVPSGGKTRYELWIEDQFTKPVSHTLAEVTRTESANAQGGAFDETLAFNAWWKSSLSGTDQLRQRVAFALSEIHVVSAQGPLDNQAVALAYFYDMLVDHAFGNFRALLEATTLTATMGRYLDMKENDKPDLIIGRSPNENYAREIKQLFSIGLFRMWPDGSLMLNSKDELIATYTQREIVGFAHVFTGWDDGYDGAFRTTLGAATTYRRPMREVPARHFTGTKRILNNEVMPGLQTLGGQPLDPYATHNSSHFNDSEYQALASKELDVSHDQLFNHPNVGPFICRQIIQRLVTSHPSRDYLYRVVQKFNDNGLGVRGDLQAVIKAILLDYEARSSTEIMKPAYGKQREAVLRVAAAGRAFRLTPFDGTYSQTGTRTITINTGTPHKLATGNNVFLDFTSSLATNAPWIGVYSATVVNTTSITVQAAGWATGTYTQLAGSNFMTISIANHWLGAGQQAYFDFTNGPADGLAGFDNTNHTAVTSTSSNAVAGTTFTIAAPDTTARSGNVMIPRFNPGSYTTSSSGMPAPNDRRVTMDCNTDHHLKVGDQVQINFFGGNPTPTDMVATVESVVDLNTWTFLAPSLGTGLAANQGNNSVYQFPLLSQPLNRSGNVSSRPSTFAMGNTDADIDQSPLNSPTVFNFFLPDYKLPGTLASQGITTPEFQETAETSVIRQANFMERGVYALGNTAGLSSFKSGNNALTLDLGPWMANAVGTSSPGSELGAGTSTTKPWTSDENLSVLIDRLNTLLLGGQLPAAVKTEIMTFVQTRANMGAAYNQTTNPYTNIPYNNSGTPTDTEKRNRIRAILHFILTSPDFTIQR